jgi:hypothetical protein
VIRTFSRKFAFVAAIPTWPLVKPASVLSTVLSPLTSADEHVGANRGCRQHLR